MIKPIENYIEFSKRMTCYRFGELYEHFRKRYNALNPLSPCLFDDNFIDKVIAQTAFAIAPNMYGAIALLDGGDGAQRIVEDDDLLHFTSFRISPQFARFLAHQAENNGGMIKDNNPLDDITLTYTSFGKALSACIVEVERRFGLQMLRSATALLDSYSDTEALGNVYLKETYTPRVKTTIENEQAFKTTTTTNTKTDMTTTEDVDTYGFDSSSPTPTGKTTTNVSGLPTDNETKVVSDGSVTDNHDKSETSYDGDNTNMKEGLNGLKTPQEMVMQEMELRKADFKRMWLNCFKQVMFIN